MKAVKLLFTSLFFILSLSLVAQKKPVKKPIVKSTEVSKPAPKPDVAADEKKVRDMIAFLEFMLNTLGSSNTSIRDKEVLITESYSKIFRDSKVQIQDDLDEERKVITNKDIVAYLKDVNFFFHDVRFEFEIENITGSTMPDGQYFYKVTTTRNLKGTTSDQKPVNNRIARFIEINYNPKDQDLKIVSIYTNEFDEKQALLTWWEDLSLEWQSIFSKKLNLSDSVNLSDLKKVITLTDLDIHGNQYIQDLDPVAQLFNLNKLNISGTKITDLSPIRNLTEIVELNLSQTKVSDLSPLKYSTKLQSLTMTDSQVNSLSALEKFSSLKSIEMRNTSIKDFAPLAALKQLQYVDLSVTQISNLSPLTNLSELVELTISNTAIDDLSPITNLTNLQIINMDSTRISTINSLSHLDKLKIVYANHTSISDLSPLKKLNYLEKVYCDHTRVERDVANTFMVAHPKVLIIFDSKDLQAWWNTLSSAWQEVFIKAAHLAEEPTIEDLAKVPLLDSVNIEGKSRIDNLEPLRFLQRLKFLVARKTSINDLSSIREHKEIEYLNISETNVADVSILNHFKALKVLKADGSKIEHIESLNLGSLERLYADNTTVDDVRASEFLNSNPKCLLIYKTEQLNRWWNNLDENWKTALIEQTATSKIVSENLHRLVERESLHIKDAPVTNLAPLREFIRLRELHLSGTAMTSLSPIHNIRSLKSLHATNSPIQKLDSLNQLTELEELDISNTPVSDVYVLWTLKTLTKLNCAGTQIKRLDALEKLEHLEYFDCSNTLVSKLTPLDYLPLKNLKCFNTKISTKAIENFKASHPECKVTYYR